MPAYPVVDADGRLVGIVRGRVLFEQEAIEISAQAGSMVGVDKEERVADAVAAEPQFRHPWLQFNLLTAFVAAAVVGVFEDTIETDRVAGGLPAGARRPVRQHRLSGARRDAARHDARRARRRARGRLVLKEAWLGLLNGMLVGLSAAVGM